MACSLLRQMFEPTLTRDCRRVASSFERGIRARCIALVKLTGRKPWAKKKLLLNYQALGLIWGIWGCDSLETHTELGSRGFC